MSALATAHLLAIWEAAVDLHPIDRALAILATAFPDQTAGELAALSIGRRDALLLEVYGTTFGAAIECLANCAHCDELLEFTLDAHAFVSPSMPAQIHWYELAAEG